MLYKVEFRLDHAPDPLEFDWPAVQKPSAAQILSIVIKKLKPHEPDPSIAEPGVDGPTPDCERLMQENGILCITLFDEKGVTIFVI